MRSFDTRSADARERALSPAGAGRPSLAERALILQRSVGNRATGRLLRASASHRLMRQSLGAIDSQPEPDIGSLPASLYVDMFHEAYYDLGYRTEGGNLSNWLTVEYTDGTLIDININDILDSDPPGFTSPTAAMRAGYVGLGGRIFPAALTRSTVPRLWAAKRGAIDVMEQYNYEFMLTALPAVMFILSLAGAMPVRPQPTRGIPRLRGRPRAGSGQGSRSTTGAGAGAVPATTTAAGGARQAVGFTRLARNAPELGGFRSGMSADEIAALNRQFGGTTTITGHPSSALAAASRQTGFWNKVAAVVREVAGRHMFNDANKRTATAIVNELTRRNQVFTGVTGPELRRVIHQVATGQLRTIEEIAAALRGF